LLLGAEPADVALHRVERVGYQLLDAKCAQDAQQVLCADAAVCCLETADYSAGNARALGKLGLGQAA
jgi:hypothetical protein